MKKIALLMCLQLMLFASITLGQDRRITGTVTHSDGDPVSGASILIKGTNQGFSADSEGRFSITVPPNAILVFSATGMKSREIRVGNSASLTVQLENADALEEVVVTALGITRSERSLGYSTQEVKGENLTLTKEQNVIGSLAGKIAGVQVTGASGASMGGTQKIKIRGVNSISGGDQPLIVVDGTPISNANYGGSAAADYGNLGQDVNPEDIESVNVLKGPAASALYGIRGQYGVIMITTRKGARGPKKVDVQLNSAYFVEKAGNFFPTQDLYGGGSSQTWRTLPNGDKYVDISVDESWGPKMDGTPVRQVFSFYPQDPEYGKLTPFVPHPNNIKDYYETGSNLNNGVTITGGNENSTFRLSVNDTRIQGVEPNTWLKRNNVGVSASLNLTDKLIASTNVNFATNSAQRPAQGSEYGARYLVQWFQRNIDMKRMRNYKYPDGTFLSWNLRRPSATTGEVTNFNPLYWNNPYFDAYENTSNDRRDRIFGDIGLTYQLLPELKMSGFVRTDMFTQNIEEITAFGGRRVPGYYTGKFQNKDMNYEFLTTYDKSFGDFSLNANVGANLYTVRYSYLTQATAGGLSAPGWYNIDASIDRPAVSSYLRRKEIRSLFGMVSLGYKNMLYLDASIRNDNSSALPENNNSYWYPSISGSFVFSELLDAGALSFGKLRLSYAQAGSDLSPYSTSMVFSPGTVYEGPGGNINTLSVPDNLNNPLIKPSFAHSYEAGIDLKFFNNRLGLDFTWYEQKNVNQIISLNVSGASGYGSATINAGLIRNRGLEFTLNAIPVQTKNFTWNSTFNLARNRNMVVELHPDLDVYNYGSTTYSSVTSYLNSYEGQPFGSLIGQAYQRDSATGKILLGTNNMPLYTPATHNFGTVLPDYTGGFLNNFQFGKVQFSAMIDFQAGGQFFSRSKMLLVRTGMDPVTAALNDKGKNVRDPVADGGGVRVDGISATTKQPVTAYVDAQSYYNTVVGRRVYEEWIFDASYIKLRELRLGYVFDKESLGNLPFRSVSLALVARNPAMIWQKAPKGLDPSELSTGSQSIGWFESGQINTVRSFGVNLNVNF